MKTETEKNIHINPTPEGENSQQTEEQIYYTINVENDESYQVPVTRIEDGKVFVTSSQNNYLNYRIYMRSGSGWLKSSVEEGKLLDSIVLVPEPVVSKPENHPDGEVVSGNFKLTPKDIINAIFPKTEE